MEKVLVGVSTYNNYGYLWKTFRHNFELSGYEADWIVVDDGSRDSDKSKLMNDLYIKNNAQVIAFKLNQGISFVKNYLFDRAVKGGYDYIVCLDNDIMLTFNWLSELVLGMREYEYVGVGAPLIYNDTTMLQKVEDIKGNNLEINSFRVDGLGAACTIIRNEVFSTIKYNEKCKTYLYEDADFHGRVKKADYSLSVFLRAQALHLPWVVWLDKEYELEKLKARHLSRKNDMQGFDASADRMQSRLLNQFIKD